MLLDIGFLIYLNNSYLKDSGSFSIKAVSSAISKSTLKEMAIDNNATNLEVSHDGSYLCYMKDNGIVIENLSNGDRYSIPQVGNMKVSTYKWIYDRDRILIAETSTAGYPYYGKLYYYDLMDKNLTEIRDNYYNKDIKISLRSSSDSVTDIDMSAQTDLTFLKVTDGSRSSRIWELNIMVSTNSLPSAVTNHIGKITCLKRSETVFYESTDSGKIYQYGNRTPISINGNSDLKILGVDQNDNIYLASMSGNQVNCVYYGSARENTWSRLVTDPSIGISDLYVTYEGNVYESLRSSHKITNLSTQAKQSYTGEIVGVFDSGFLTKVNNQVTTSDFK